MNIVLMVIDALRADHVSCYGYSRPTTPNLEHLLSDAVFFDHCYASTTWTGPSAATILTGLYPSVHGVHKLMDKLPQELRTLPEYLKSSGFRTAVFSPGGNFSASLGFERGFDLFETFDTFSQNLNAANIASRKVIKRLSNKKFGTDLIVIPAAEDMVHAYLQWRADNSALNTFAMLWMIDTHAPFNPPPEFRVFSRHHKNKFTISMISASTEEDAQSLIDFYDDEILYVDHSIGELIETLRSRGQYDDTLLIITSDHGEAFLEHGVAGHGQPPFEELLHVPLIVKLPELQYGGRRLDDLVWLGDIMPSVLNWAGVSAHDVQGQRLLPQIDKKQINDKKVKRDFVFSETMQSGIWRRWLSIQSKRWKYIKLVPSSLPPRQFMLRQIRRLLVKGKCWKIAGNPFRFYKKRLAIPNEMLFDLSNDPKEKHNLIEQHPEKVAALRERLEAWETENQELSQLLRVKSSAMTTEEQRVIKDHLRALGYLD